MNAWSSGCKAIRLCLMCKVCIYTDHRSWQICTSTAVRPNITMHHGCCAGFQSLMCAGDLRCPAWQWSCAGQMRPSAGARSQKHRRLQAHAAGGRDPLQIRPPGRTLPGSAASMQRHRVWMHSFHIYVWHINGSSTHAVSISGSCRNQQSEWQLLAPKAACASKCA